MAGDGALDDGYYDLGLYTWPVSTDQPEAQTWFDRGMAWCYGFNHDEAIACFEHALALDPDLAMAHWGIAYAIGPNYNKPWEDFDEDDLRQSLELARSATAAAARSAAAATPVEQALIAAVAERYPSPPTTPPAPTTSAPGTTPTPTPCGPSTRPTPTTSTSAPCSPRPS